MPSRRARRPRVNRREPASLRVRGASSRGPPPAADDEVDLAPARQHRTESRLLRNHAAPLDPRVGAADLPDTAVGAREPPPRDTRCLPRDVLHRAEARRVDEHGDGCRVVRTPPGRACRRRSGHRSRPIPGALGPESEVHPPPEAAMPAAQKRTNGVHAFVSGREVGLPIPVQVADSDRDGKVSPGPVLAPGRETTVARVGEHGDRATSLPGAKDGTCAGIRRGQIRLAVAVQVADRNLSRVASCPIVALGPETAVASVEKHGNGLPSSSGPSFAATRSSLPSPFRSPIATE